jgi:hypothetical protein
MGDLLVRAFALPIAATGGRIPGARLFVTEDCAATPAILIFNLVLAGNLKLYA